jgi:hypothetical protein
MVGTYVALVFGSREQRGRGVASPGRLERTRKFFRGWQVGDNNNIYIKKKKFKIHHNICSCFKLLSITNYTI